MEVIKISNDLPIELKEWICCGRAIKGEDIRFLCHLEAMNKIIKADFDSVILIEEGLNLVDDYYNILERFIPKEDDEDNSTDTIILYNLEDNLDDNIGLSPLPNNFNPRAYWMDRDRIEECLSKFRHPIRKLPYPNLSPTLFFDRDSSNILSKSLVS